MVSELDLADLYQLNFTLHKEHGFSLDQIEGMLPYERGVYVDLLKAWLAEEAKRLEDLNR